MVNQLTPGLRVAEDNSPRTLTEIQRATRFFYLQNHVFAGNVTGQTFGTANTGTAINLLPIEKNLSAAWRRLSGIYFGKLPGWNVRNAMILAISSTAWPRLCGVDFPSGNYERMADVMRRCKGKVLVHINVYPDIRLFEGFHFETLDTRNCNTNQRQGAAETSDELVITNWEPALVGGLI
jgi:DNA adenine methylase